MPKRKSFTLLQYKLEVIECGGLMKWHSDMSLVEFFNREPGRPIGDVATCISEENVRVNVFNATAVQPRARNDDW